jgi:hypothetical protein
MAEATDDRDRREGPSTVDRVRAWLRAALPRRRTERPLWRPLPRSGRPAWLPVAERRR